MGPFNQCCAIATISRTRYCWWYCYDWQL